MEIARALLTSSATPADLIIAARAFAAAEQTDSALQLLEAIDNRRRNTRLLRMGTEVIELLPDDADPDRLEAIRRKLMGRRMPRRDAAEGG